MDPTETNHASPDEAQCIVKEVEKIRLQLLFDMQRLEHDINERFTTLKTKFHLKQPKLVQNETNNSLRRQMTDTRVFVPRNSVLTDLFKISHIRVVRTVFAAVLIIFVLQAVINDIVTDGSVNLKFHILRAAFAKVHVALFIWLLMQLSTAIVVFMGFNSWTKHRNSYKNHLRVYDSAWILIYLIYLILFLVLPCHQVVKHQLAIASSVIVLLEQLRQLMKTHAFIRENAAKTLSLVESKTDGNKYFSPDFSHYLYFLFAPTLIYRDQYPRTARIHWDYVLQMFGQFAACVLYFYYLVTRFCMPTFEHLNQNEITLPQFVSVISSSIMPGSLFLVLGFYGLLHCWLNAFAEMLRFADRMFYNDWWNSTSFAEYYRKWNVVVHDWLHAYVYREIYILIGRRNRWIPTICVVLLSATFHEYVMIFSLGVFYPIMFFLYAFVGLIFFFVLPRNKGPAYNMFVLTALMIGIGLQTCFYFMEAYERKSCATTDTFWGRILPQPILCRN